MKLFAALLILVLLTGCMTTYSVERVMPDGSFVKVETRSFRKFEQPTLEYETPDGTVFRFNAESASTQYSPVEYAAADLMKAVTIGSIPLPSKQETPQ